MTNKLDLSNRSDISLVSDIETLVAGGDVHTVTVVIPTLNRHDALQRAIRSVVRQEVAGDIGVDVVVVDNSADGNSREVVHALVSETGYPVRWIHEPRTGVSSARNRGVRAAEGRWVAFLDDDEEAKPKWINSLVEVARKTGADAIFGPVEAKSDGTSKIDEFVSYFSRRIDRPEGGDITDLVAYLGTNNSMFDRKRCLELATPFDTTLNTSGGEDSLLLKQLTVQGRRLAWAPKAGVVEWVPERRLNWEYVRRRTFLSGQIRVFVLHKLRPINWLRIGLWMGVGLVQFSLGSIAMAVFKPFDEARYRRASVLCYGGLGKMLWMSKFRPALYGSGLVS